MKSFFFFFLVITAVLIFIPYFINNKEISELLKWKLFTNNKFIAGGRICSPGLRTSIKALKNSEEEWFKDSEKEKEQ